jgi:hypothetical protein
MSTWSDIAGIVGKAAPVIGGLLGGPAGAAVGGLISSALGTENSPDAVSAALAGNPDAIVKVQELQTNAKVQLQQLAVTAEQNRLSAATAQYAAEAADRDSARKLAGQQPRDWMRPLLSLLIIAATIGIVFLVLLGVADGTLKDPVIAATAGGLVMYFIRESSQVLGFWFGMTREASVQNQAITAFATSPGTVTLEQAGTAFSTLKPSPTTTSAQQPQTFLGN